MTKVGMVVLLGVSFILSLALAQENSQSTSTQWQAPARAAKKKNPIPLDEKSIAIGKGVYKRECLSCHGATGRGDGPAAKDLERSVGDLSNPEVLQQTDGALFWKITEGNKPMPSFKKLLTDEERWHVVNYLRTFTESKE